MTALDGLTVDVEPGIIGLVGANGAGKSTLIKIMLGLLDPSEGSVRVLGLDPAADGEAVRARVGYMPEHGSLPPDMIAAEFVTHMARISGLPRTAARERASEALRHVGLYEERYRQIGGYSTGMKQRVTLAQALVHDPDLLLLDEPTNGLDPAGIRGIREMIRDLGDSGVTVLLSSHILAEVQQVCHSVSIVGDGRLLASGRVEDLLGENVSRTRVGVSDPQGARHFLEAAGYTVTLQGDVLVVEGHERPDQITRLLAAKGVYVSELSAIRPTLESFFLRLTGRSRPGGTDATVETPTDEEAS